MAEKASDLEKRTPMRVPQESIDFVLQGIKEIKTDSDIARGLAKAFGLKFKTAQSRVRMVWQALAKEAKLDNKVERHKISHAILDIYRRISKDTDLNYVLEQLREHDISPEHRWRLLSKWDPYKGYALALKALDQYTRLHGVQAPEQVEVHNTHEIANPLMYTPQERKKRITELLAKRELEGPYHDPDLQSVPTVEERAN